MNRLTQYAAAAALALTGTAATVAAASATPMLAQPSAPALIEHVAWGCGPGWHPNDWGRCVPNRGVVYPRYYRPGPVFHVWHPHPVWHPHRVWHRWRHW
ncbi:hypothetical protein [Mesorhizobium sp. B2-6-1]|uniref:GCG_CRPN prefix-to-repeats domain-containing protein n=1 Tax=Mesorhizobium sp. B2-6-1 TaxID=2589916 RepID=UPI00112C6A6E|nr:hypothetical protein [Mesorhizobium sp. B2-6-1]TPJ63640.1 hypothetical protein FJ443_11285 [Mesorhizobium sp. B2-6-1]